MTCEVFSSTHRDADFTEACARFGEAWRWRVAGLTAMAVSAVLTTTLYWKLGVFLVSVS